MKIIIKYVGIALVIVGILLVMKNLVAKESTWDTNTNKNKKETYYNATIKLLDKDTNSYVSGAKLVLKNSKNELIAEWTTKDSLYIVNKLKKGTYTLSEISAADNYHLNEENITFEIKTKDINVVMYNTKMTEEEVRKANTTESNVNVDNTASSKSVVALFIAFISTFMGLYIIYKVKNNY